MFISISIRPHAKFPLTLSQRSPTIIFPDAPSIGSDPRFNDGLRAMHSVLSVDGVREEDLMVDGTTVLEKIGKYISRAPHWFIACPSSELVSLFRSSRTRGQGGGIHSGWFSLIVVPLPEGGSQRAPNRSYKTTPISLTKVKKVLKKAKKGGFYNIFSVFFPK